jgi:hypothetical protein
MMTTMQAANATLTTQQPAIRWGLVLRSSLKGFGINLVILAGMHPILPLAFAAPFITGLITGGRQFMTGTEGFLLGTLMGLWMMILLSLLAGGFVIATALRLLPAGGMDMMLFAIIPTFIVAHLAIFCSVGAMLGGHFARKDKVTASTEAPAIA